MVAVIKTGHSIHRILNYNEQKVKQGVAECISAENYAIDVQNLSLKFKLNRLVSQAALNENVSRNSVHISLNFDPSEKLSNGRLQEISDTYMQKIGFAKQPYLVYKHFDSGHPHVHIVSIKVRADGSRIDTQNIGRNQSEIARKEIEQSFGLVKAEDSKQAQAYELNPVNVQRLQYGRSETKRAITNVLDAVLKNYKYASLSELNAVLLQYNVIADRGSEDSRIFQKKGLTYRIVDGNGNKVGVPIKASNFYSRPTLKFLEERYGQNETARQPFKIRIKNAIDLSFFKKTNHSLHDLKEALDKQGIKTVVRQNADGIIYGITYVDHVTKCVFNGSVLGKQYSAKGILERCGQSGETCVASQQFVKQPAATMDQLATNSQPLQNEDNETLMDMLLQPEHTSGYVPNQLTGRGKKKKKKSLTNRL